MALQSYFLKAHFLQKHTFLFSSKKGNEASGHKGLTSRDKLFIEMHCSL